MLKMARLEAKRTKMELQIKLKQERERLQIELEQDRKRFEERALVLQQQTQQTEIAHEKRMIALRERMKTRELELARLKAGQHKVDG